MKAPLQFLEALKKDGVVQFFVRVRPGSPVTRFVAFMDDESIKIDIAAPAEKGRANAELLRFLAREFEAHPSQVAIVSGATARIKLVRVTNVSG